jgi:hypothetical protein
LGTRRAPGLPIRWLDDRDVAAFDVIHVDFFAVELSGEV